MTLGAPEGAIQSRPSGWEVFPYMNRQWRSVSLGLLLLVAALGLGSVATSCGPDAAPTDAPAQADDERPNVLLISIDTLRADHLSGYGYSRPTSPAIDAFAKRGVVFEQAYSHSPKTAPSHMSLMTSLLPEAHGVRQLSHDGARRLSDEIPTLARVLQRHGYRTGAITAGGNAGASLGFDQGMHSFQVIYDVSTLVKSAAVQLQAMQGVSPEREPLFLFLHTYEVHDPYTPVMPYQTMFTDPNYSGAIRSSPSDDVGAGSEVFQRTHESFWSSVDKQDPEDVQHLKDLYDGSIRRVDTELASLFKWMQPRGLLRNTLVVILSDHGEEFADHGAFLHTRVYQELLHVPLIMLFPAKDRGRFGRRRIETPVRLIDVMPTLLDYLGIQAPDGIQGQSLMPLLRGEQLSPLPIMSSYGRRGYLALREGRWKWIGNEVRRLSGEGFVTHEELYDLEQDAGEQKNLAGREVERAKQMSSRATKLDAEAKQFQATRVGAPIDADEHELEELRALGYVE